MNPRAAISRLRTRFEDEVLTAPDSSFRENLRGCNPDEVHQKTLQLEREGYISLGKVFNPVQLELIKKHIDSAIEGGIPSVKTYWNEGTTYWQIFSPLRLDALFLELATTPMIVAVAESYFRRPVYLADVDMRRVMPAKIEEIMNARGYSSSNWHRDARGRQLKMMVYLSDVGENDSCFSFLPKTHCKNYSRKRTYMESRFSDEAVASMGGERIDWVGPAGEAYLFDTNLIHRLCRKPEANIRDTFTCYYTPGQELRVLDYDQSTALALPSDRAEVFGSPTNRLFRSRMNYRTPD